MGGKGRASSCIRSPGLHWFEPAKIPTGQCSPGLLAPALGPPLLHVESSCKVGMELAGSRGLSLQAMRGDGGGRMVHNGTVRGALPPARARCHAPASA